MTTFLKKINRLLKVLFDITESSSNFNSKVLVVDDDSQIRDLLRRFLSGAQREIISAACGKEALEIIKSTQLSLIILDLSLPDMDGREVLALIRDDEDTKSLPVIILSGLGGISPKTECYAFGADIFFEKPFDWHALSAAVSARLRHSLNGLRVDA